jgi:hypothetical protein
VLQEGLNAAQSVTVQLGASFRSMEECAARVANAGLRIGDRLQARP